MKPKNERWTLEELESQFKKGDIVTIRFDVRKCIVKIDHFEREEPFDEIDCEVLIVGLGVDAKNRVFYKSYGSNTNDITHSKEKDIMMFNKLVNMSRMYVIEIARAMDTEHLNSIICALKEEVELRNKNRYE